MRLLPTLICASLAVSSARAQHLSSADREALLENLEKMRETADSKVDARFRVAMVACKEALASDDATIGFYLKCVGKLNFYDKKPSEFREWKHKESGRLNDPAFHFALRIQLRWLMLTLQSFSEKADPDAIGAEAQSVVDELFREANRLQAQEQTLNQAATSTVFAKTYGIVLPEKSRIPATPVQVDRVYGQVIFPPLRTPARVEALRAAWTRRIQQEEIKVQVWPAHGGKAGQAAQDLDKFIAETMPDLQWQMEVDLFHNGDENGSARRMLAHIEKHLESPSARAWSDEFKSLLAPRPATPATAPAP